MMQPDPGRGVAADSLTTEPKLGLLARYSRWSHARCEFLPLR
jgi:hypothetical protein